MNQATWTRIVVTLALFFPCLGALGYFVLAQDQWLQIIYGASKVIQFALPAFWMFAVLKEKFIVNKPTSLQVFAGLRTGAGLSRGSSASGIASGTPEIHESAVSQRPRIPGKVSFAAVTNF